MERNETFKERSRTERYGNERITVVKPLILKVKCYLYFIKPCCFNFEYKPGKISELLFLGYN